MGEKTRLRANSVNFITILLALWTSGVRMEITRPQSGVGNMALPLENGVPDWITIRQTARGIGVEGDKQVTDNVSLNQLAENLNRLEGNLASLIESFLSLQRSVFNLEQLQELLVLLLEDILKQNGNVNQDGAVSNPSNPASSVSNESLERDDNDDGVDSAEIDEDGDDIDENIDHKEKEENQGGAGKGNANGKEEGGGKRSGNPGTDPFGALESFNTPVTTFKPTPEENRKIPTENKNKSPNKENEKDDDDDDDESEEYVERREMGSSGESMESGEVMRRVNNVRSKNTSPDLREPLVPQKPRIQEPLVTFAAQLEARLNDMLHRLTPTHEQHGRRMALLRRPDRRSFLINTGESPMAPPPRFEPLEIVAEPGVVPVKETKVDSQPVRVKLQRQEMSPIVSHGGPRVGPEDFSSVFMENLGGKVEDGAESLNERSTGMINNMMQFGESGQVPLTATQAALPSKWQPETLPSLADRRRRQAKTKVSGRQSYQSSKSMADEKAPMRIAIVNLPQQKSSKSRPQTTPGTPSSIQPTRPTTTSDDFDALIADLLHDLSQHLQEQYLHNKHNTALGKDIDRAVLEINSLVWIPSSTVTNKNPLPESTKIPETRIGVPPTPSPEVDNHKMSKQTFHAPDLANNHSPETAGVQMDQTGKNESKDSMLLPSQKQSIPNGVPTDATTGPTQPHNAENKTETENAMKYNQWDWLRQLPVHPTQNMDVEWLIDTLMTVSEVTTSPEDLQSINDRGVQLLRHFNTATNQSENAANADSEEESIELEEDEDDEDPEGEVTSVEDTSEGDDEMAGHDDLHKKSNDDVKQYASVTETQLTNDDSFSEFLNNGNIDDANDNDNIMQGDPDIVSSDEEGSEELDNDVDENDGDETYNEDDNDDGRDNIEDNYDDEVHEDEIDAEIDEEDEQEDGTTSVDGNDESKENESSGKVTTPPTTDNDISAIKQILSDDYSDRKIMSNQNNKQTKNHLSEESYDDTVAENASDDNKSEESMNDESYDTDSFETLANSIKDFGDVESQQLEPLKHANAPTYLGQHIINKRHAQHRLRLLPLQRTVDKKTKQVYHRNAEPHIIRKRQIPPFWDFLNANNNNPQPNNQASSNLFDLSQPFGPSLANPFTSHLNHQQTNGLHNTLFNQPSVFDPQPDQAIFQQNHQPGHPSLTNHGFGNSPQHSLTNQGFGNSPQHTLTNPGFGNSPQHTSQFGNPPADTPPTGDQLPKQPAGKGHLPSLTQQNPPNPFWPQSPLSGNFPFHPPIGGYPQYHGYNGGFHYPQFGYPGNAPSNYEPGESPAAEAAADMEEILTNLFNRYWENVSKMFGSKGPPTTQETEYEGPITTTTTTPPPPPTTTTRKTTRPPPPPQTTTVTTAAPKPMKATPIPIIDTTVPPPTATTIQHTPTPRVKTTLNQINPTTNLTALSNVSQSIESNSSFPATNMNSTMIVNTTNQTIGASTVSSPLNMTNNSPTMTSLPASSTSLPSQTAAPSTPSAVIPNRGSTYLFDLIKSLEMMTRKPAI